MTVSDVGEHLASISACLRPIYCTCAPSPVACFFYCVENYAVAEADGDGVGVHLDAVEKLPDLFPTFHQAIPCRGDLIGGQLSSVPARTRPDVANYSTDKVNGSNWWNLQKILGQTH